MAKEQSKLSKKIDSICRVLFLTEEGKPKSATLLYSFCLSLLFVLIYSVSYFLLIDVIENAFASSTTQLRYVLEVLGPAIAGTVPCALLSLCFKEKKGLPFAAYRWMAVFIIIVLFMGIFYFDADDYVSFMSILGIPAVVSVVCGGYISRLIYKRRSI